MQILFLNRNKNLKILYIQTFEVQTFFDREKPQNTFQLTSPDRQGHIDFPMHY